MNGGAGKSGAGIGGAGMGRARASRIGGRGEQAAAEYLAERGYRLLDRNWRSRDPDQRGELDLVLRHRGTLVVCEVKARTGARLAHPAEAVTPEKAARLRRLAVLWLRDHAHAARPARPRGRLPIGRRPRAVAAAEVRIDVVAVWLGPREPFPVLGVEHLPGVA